MMVALVICVLLGAALWLDRVFILQTLVSRPIVLAPVLALACGNLELGLLIGATLELLWLNAPPVGAFLPYDETFCAAVAVPVGLVAVNTLDTQAAAGLATVVCLPTALVGRWVDTRLRTANETLMREDTTRIPEKISAIMFKALSRAYLYALAALAVCTVALGMVTYLLRSHIAAPVATALAFLPFASVIIGLTGLVGSRRLQSRSVWAGAFVLGMVIIAVWSWLQ